MLPWTMLGCARIPGESGELQLHQRGGEFSIRVGGYELMNSRIHGSEETMAEVVYERLTKHSSSRYLIGGLGMGFTLAAVLKQADSRSRVVVAELVPEVVTWNRGVLGSVAGQPLGDRRAIVRESDVGQVIRESKAAFDAILLDVDNGPAGLTSKSNDWLYGEDGLRASFEALRPRGVLAVWSAGPDKAFTRRLARAGFVTEELPVRARGAAGGSRFLIWVASRA